MCDVSSVPPTNNQPADLAAIQGETATDEENR